MIVPADEVNGKEELLTVAYMCVYDPKKDKTGFGRTGSYALPDKVAKLVKAGTELGIADDQVSKLSYLLYRRPSASCEKGLARF